MNGANTFFSDQAPGSNSISNITGLILENSSVKNPNIFATITFNAKNAGTSYIELQNIKISDPNGDLLGVNMPARTNLNVISNTNTVGNSGTGGGSSAGGGGGAGGTSGEDFSNIEIKEKYDTFLSACPNRQMIPSGYIKFICTTTMALFSNSQTGYFLILYHPQDISPLR